ncbi:SAM-dependent methyltransferase [Streptomyces sp. NPDC093225]|uniref:SAM-dependent methyltransferase n=1 Tax=Streptomyces sp. NPDC093225 TaxID=3366034 RepID=UPI0037FDADE4
MNRDQISMLAHADHPISAPVGDDAVRRLLDHAVVRGDERVLDLGCGRGEWLLRALAAHPGLRGEGVDLSETSLAHAREAARARGVEDRLTLHQEDAGAFTSPHLFDVVFVVAATHAFGGLSAVLATARKHLAPGGRVLLGDGIWVHEPDPEAVEMLGEMTDLASTVDLVTAEGWVPVQGHVSSREELDAYEWAWTGSLASWALDHPDDPGSAQALEAAATHRTEWLRSYRDIWGFVCMVLRPTAS